MLVTKLDYPNEPVQRALMAAGTRLCSLLGGEVSGHFGRGPAACARAPTLLQLSYTPAPMRHTCPPPHPPPAAADVSGEQEDHFMLELREQEGAPTNGGLGTAAAAEAASAGPAAAPRVGDWLCHFTVVVPSTPGGRAGG